MIKKFAGKSKVVDKPDEFQVKVDQINDLASHDDGRLNAEVDHPRAAHNLLVYHNTISSFTKKNRKKYQKKDEEVMVCNTWIGPELSFK